MEQQLDLLALVSKQEINAKLQALLQENLSFIPLLDAEAQQALVHGFVLGYTGNSELIKNEFAELGQGAKLGQEYSNQLIEGLENLPERIVQAKIFAQHFNGYFKDLDSKPYSSMYEPGSWQQGMVS
ncbi:hypothetical protein [Pseudoalteromonas rubra]|uniref:hypothetical protein n=1 Tax=Pseudoalteromonas rubra TaxID=43658 RepID=UPI002DB905F2|nr:hypothetical protein [Pseudoalteromonas rubra]MEC4091824.1 hypothetical protein [Pseudoalteromonas rubra]